MDDLAPLINHTMDSFGPDRVMFGGDWPVCTLAATYKEWVDSLKQVVKSRSEEQQKKLFHDTIVVLTTLVLMSVFLFAMDQFWRIFLTKAGVLRFGQDSVQKNTSVDLKKW